VRTRPTDLASKAIGEHLDAAAAAAVGLDQDRTLGDVPTATAKARRDARCIAVREIG